LAVGLPRVEVTSRRGAPGLVQVVLPVAVQCANSGVGPRRMWVAASVCDSLHGGDLGWSRAGRSGAPWRGLAGAPRHCRLMVRRGPAGSSSPWTVGRRDGSASRMLELQPSCWRPSEAPPFHPAARHDSRFPRRWRRSSRDLAGGGFGRRSAIPSMGATLGGGS
jgi:hypothetical protein